MPISVTGAFLHIHVFILCLKICSKIRGDALVIFFYFLIKLVLSIRIRGGHYGTVYSTRANIVTIFRKNDL